MPGVEIRLLRKDTGEEVKIGDRVTDFRGEEHTLLSVYPFDGMTGKVALDGELGLYYPSVIGCEFVPVEID